MSLQLREKEMREVKVTTCDHDRSNVIQVVKSNGSDVELIACMVDELDESSFFAFRAPALPAADVETEAKWLASEIPVRDGDIVMICGEDYKCSTVGSNGHELAFFDRV